MSPTEPTTGPATEPTTERTGVAVQDRLDAYWSGRAPDYDAYQQRPERRELDREVWARVWSRVLPAAPARVLDVGTGPGTVACLLAELGHDVTGTDLAEGMLVQARRHAEGMANPPRFLPGDAVDPDAPDGSLDAVTNRYLMWTLREPGRALARWRRALRPGGVLAVVDGQWFAPGTALAHRTSDTMGEHYTEQVWSALPLSRAGEVSALVDLVREAGFVDVHAEPLLEVLELDRREGVAPGHELTLQHLVSARAPG